MNVDEAKRIIEDFDERSNPSAEEEFAFIEALEYLIEKEKKPSDMMYLGGYYYEIRRFDLALKYYEMAASFDYDEAYECLGYIWYYGRTGERDYEKAFKYFSKLKDKGNPVAAYKVADMYKNGYYVEKDRAKYAEIIEELYPRVRECTNVFDPIPEVFTRLARIRTEQGRKEEAVELYLDAKDCLAQRISINSFFGNLNIMKWMIDDLYSLVKFDNNNFDFFDLYYLLKTPHRIVFEYEGKRYLVESVMEGKECTVNFDGKWFRGRDEFFANAIIEGEKAVAVQEDMYGFKLLS